MNNYITTNIRLPEDDYLRLKKEATITRKSLSAIIREKISIKKQVDKSPDDIIKKIRAHAAESKDNLGEIDIVKTLREMRNQGKW